MILLYSSCCTPAAITLQRLLLCCCLVGVHPHRMLIQGKQENAVCLPQTSIIIIININVYFYMQIHEHRIFNEDIMLHFIAFMAYRLICNMCPSVAFYEKYICSAVQHKYCICNLQ